MEEVARREEERACDDLGFDHALVTVCNCSPVFLMIWVGSCCDPVDPRLSQ
jgi:hypothetical protein